MQLNIKNPETVSLAKELSALMNKPVTQVLTEVLRERVKAERQNQPDPFEARFPGAQAMIKEFQQKATHLGPDDHADVLYDEKWAAEMKNLSDHQVIDTSALIAILYNEPDSEIYKDALSRSEATLIATPTFVELGLVLKHRMPNSEAFDLKKLLERMRITRIALTAQQSDLALAAKYQFPVLNFGDTFAYALAKDLDLPLLFKGNDFSQTDLKSAIYSGSE